MSNKVTVEAPKVLEQAVVQILEGNRLNIIGNEDPMVIMRLLLVGIKTLLDSGRIGAIEQSMIEVPNMGIAAINKIAKGH